MPVAAKTPKILVRDVESGEEKGAKSVAQALLIINEMISKEKMGKQATTYGVNMAITRGDVIHGRIKVLRSGKASKSTKASSQVIPKGKRKLRIKKRPSEAKAQETPAEKRQKQAPPAGSKGPAPGIPSTAVATKQDKLKDEDVAAMEDQRKKLAKQNPVPAPAPYEPRRPEDLTTNPLKYATEDDRLKEVSLAPPVQFGPAERFRNLRERREEMSGIVKNTVPIEEQKDIIEATPSMTRDYDRKAVLGTQSTKAPTSQERRLRQGLEFLVKRISETRDIEEKRQLSIVQTNAARLIQVKDFAGAETKLKPFIKEAEEERIQPRIGFTFEPKTPRASIYAQGNDGQEYQLVVEGKSKNKLYDGSQEAIKLFAEAQASPFVNQTLKRAAKEFIQRSEQQALERKLAAEEEAKRLEDEAKLAATVSEREAARQRQLAQQNLADTLQQQAELAEKAQQQQNEYQQTKEAATSDAALAQANEDAAAQGDPEVTFVGEKPGDVESNMVDLVAEERQQELAAEAKNKQLAKAAKDKETTEKMKKQVQASKEIAYSRDVTDIKGYLSSVGDIVALASSAYKDLDKIPYEGIYSKHENEGRQEAFVNGLKQISSVVDELTLKTRGQLGYQQGQPMPLNEENNELLQQIEKRREDLFKSITNEVVVYAQRLFTVEKLEEAQRVLLQAYNELVPDRSLFQTEERMDEDISRGDALDMARAATEKPDPMTGGPLEVEEVQSAFPMEEDEQKDVGSTGTLLDAEEIEDLEPQEMEEEVARAIKILEEAENATKEPRMKQIVDAAKQFQDVYTKSEFVDGVILRNMEFLNTMRTTYNEDQINELEKEVKELGMKIASEAELKDAFEPGAEQYGLDKAEGAVPVMNELARNIALLFTGERARMSGLGKKEEMKGLGLLDSAYREPEEVGAPYVTTSDDIKDEIKALTFNRSRHLQGQNMKEDQIPEFSRAMAFRNFRRNDMSYEGSNGEFLVPTDQIRRPGGFKRSGLMSRSGRATLSKPTRVQSVNRDGTPGQTQQPVYDLTLDPEDTTKYRYTKRESPFEVKKENESFVENLRRKAKFEEEERERVKSEKVPKPEPSTTGQPGTEEQKDEEEEQEGEGMTRIMGSGMRTRGGKTGKRGGIATRRHIHASC